MTNPTKDQIAGQRLIELAHTIAADEKYATFPWTGITAIVTMRWDGMPELIGTRAATGYVYTATPMNAAKGSTQCWQAAMPSRASWPAFRWLAEAVAERDSNEPFRHCLFQLDRDSGKVTVDFSYDETNPWRADIDNLDNFAESLRPPSR